MRVPVLKTCDHCGGSGNVAVTMTDGTTCGNFTSWVTCQECEGRGVVETDMFVDVDMGDSFGANIVYPIIGSNQGAKDA